MFSSKRISSLIYAALLLNIPFGSATSAFSGFSSSSSDNILIPFEKTMTSSLLNVNFSCITQTIQSIATALDQENPANKMTMFNSSIATRASTSVLQEKQLLNKMFYYCQFIMPPFLYKAYRDALISQAPNYMECYKLLSQATQVESAREMHLLYLFSQWATAVTSRPLALAKKSNGRDFLYAILCSHKTSGEGFEFVVLPRRCQAEPCPRALSIESCLAVPYDLISFNRWVCLSIDFDMKLLNIYEMVFPCLAEGVKLYRTEYESLKTARLTSDLLREQIFRLKQISFFLISSILPAMKRKDECDVIQKNLCAILSSKHEHSMLRVLYRCMKLGK